VIELKVNGHSHNVSADPTPRCFTSCGTICSSMPPSLAVAWGNAAHARSWSTVLQRCRV